MTADENKQTDHDTPKMAKRFRGYLPVVIDVETAGFNAKKDALLEIAAILLAIDDHGNFYKAESLHYHIKPFPGANLDPAALAFTGIKPFHPFRFAVDEKEGLVEMFKEIRKIMKVNDCNRSVLVGHNAFFDLSFIQEAAKRCKLKRNPFHPFTTFDTAALSAVALGQTVLSRACLAANIEFDAEQAHSALYDADKTAELFCWIVNRWHYLSALEEE